MCDYASIPNREMEDTKMPNWLILTAYAAGMALLVAAAVYQGVTVAAADLFMADSFSAKWITNEHYRGQ